jgi:cobyrinic acid a,c-diamide synthase
MKVFGVTSPYTGSGKTTITLAMLSAMKNSTSAKIGPDYIDKDIHFAVNNNMPYNLDRWIQGNRYREIFFSSLRGFDYAVIEGVMGLYDSGSPIKLSTMYYFTKMKIPYILVVDAYKVAESGYYIARSFIGKLCIGVIINNYAGLRHLEMVSKPFVEHGIRIIGSIPHDDDFSLPERHLGISTDTSPDKIKSIAAKVAKHIELDFLDDLPEIYPDPDDAENPSFENSKNNIWVAKDSAFSFYYEDSMVALRKLGKVSFFSPLKNEEPIDADMIYLGGGYPELYIEELSRNHKTKNAIKNFAESGKIVLGECGGLMYMESEISKRNGKRPMLGIFEGLVEKNSKLTIGYTQMKVVNENPVFKINEIVRGHEFHYSSIKDTGKKCLRMEIGRGIDGMDGLTHLNSFGSYSHFSLFRYRKRIGRALDKIKK